VFYRFVGGARVAVDMDGLYQNVPLFLLGGGPELNLAPAGLRHHATLGMNNTPLTRKPNLWVGLDKPHCFDPSIYHDPTITKFTMITRRDLKSDGVELRDLANVYFFGTYSPKEQDFLAPHRDIVWWKSVFPAALQLAHRLGFAPVYLVGCGFHGGGKYAHGAHLTDPAEIAWTSKTYDQDIDRLKRMAPLLRDWLVSCTEGSRANEILSYVPLSEALARHTNDRTTAPLLHSSNKGTPCK